MKTVLTYFVLFCSSCPILTLGQVAKDYYYPATKNKASFYMPDTVGNRTLVTTLIYYLQNQGRYEVLTTSFFKGEPGKIETEHLQFTASEVRLTRLISTNQVETNAETIYNPPKVLLRIPDAGLFTASWSYTETSGQKSDFLAEWTTVKINGKDVDALKVTERFTLPNGSVFGARLISYYAYGIGLWRQEAEVKNRRQAILVFESLDFDKSASIK